VLFSKFALAPFFDNVHACQDSMRQRFVSRNGRGAADIDFDGFPNRQNQDQGRKLIRGSGAAKNWNELQDLTYSCVMDTRSGQVQSGDYQDSAGGVRTNERSRLQ
jgi:hypothetical protein